MITEQELEQALELRKDIRDLKVYIAKLETIIISKTENIGSTVSIDGNKIVVDIYTENTITKFKDDILKISKLKLEDLKEKYKEIVELPEDTY